MKILAVGNSVSQDATRYLHGIAKADDCDLVVVNLHAGGGDNGSLYSHYKNVLTHDKAYSLEFNGEETGFRVSLKDGLLANNWDYVTLQQASKESADYDTYQPYLGELAKYIRKYCPKAKLVIHQTWAYEDESEKLTQLGYSDRLDMSIDVKDAYRKAAKDVKADLTIPACELFSRLSNTELEGLRRNSFNASRGIGRYALGLLWYSTLTGRSVLDNGFSEFDEPIDNDTVKFIKKNVESLW